MKHLIVFVLGILSFTDVAFACPNFEGHYTFVEQPWNGSIVVKQKDCQKITVTHVRDYQGRHNEEIKEIYADARMHGGTMAYWLGSALVIQQYLGDQEKCGGQFLFNESKCHLVETSLTQLSGKAEEFVYAQTGIWWKENGRYQKDRYAVMRERETENGKPLPRYAKN